MKQENLLASKIHPQHFLSIWIKEKYLLVVNIKVLHQEEFDQSLHIGLDDTNLTISIKSASNLYITKILICFKK